MFRSQKRKQIFYQNASEKENLWKSDYAQRSGSAHDLISEEVHI